MNALHIKLLLYYRRCSFFALELRVSYYRWAMALNMHHSLFLTCNFVHVSIITQTLWPLEVFQAFRGQIKSGRPQIRCGLHVGVERKVGVAKYKFLLFFNLDFTCTYATTFPDLNFWEHASYDWQAKTLNAHHSWFLIRLFVHISSITRNYGHLMSTRPIVGKWKVATPGNRCNTYGK